jgi:hypothetical protein
MLLTSLHQDTSTHISDHIYEWKRRRRLIKTHIPDQLLMDWFIKSLLLPITNDVSMVGVVIEENAIFIDQHLDLIYSQCCTLYDVISHTPQPSMDLHRSNSGPHVDGVMVSISSLSTIRKRPCSGGYSGGF